MDTQVYFKTINDSSPRKDTDMTTITLELNDISQEQLDDLMNQEELCLNHLVSRELQKLMEDTDNVNQKLWSNIPRESEVIGKIRIDSGCLTLIDPDFIGRFPQKKDYYQGNDVRHFNLSPDRPGAIVAKIGFGGGFYPVIAERLKTDNTFRNDRISRISIPFI